MNLEWCCLEERCVLEAAVVSLGRCCFGEIWFGGFAEGVGVNCETCCFGETGV